MSSGYYVFDKEANGLDRGHGVLSEDASKIWCTVLHDLVDGTTIEGDIVGGFDRVKHEISNAKMLVGHNILDYDIPLMERMWGIQPPQDCVIVDTLVWSRTLYPDRSMEGGHGLEAWGKRNNCPKPPVEDWSTYDPEKLHRCHMDVQNNVITYQKLLQEAHMYDSAHTLWLEQEVSKIISKQCKRGHNFNKPLAEWLLGKLEKWLQEIDKSLQPYVQQKPKLLNKPVNQIRKKNGDYCEAIKQWYGEEIERSAVANPEEPCRQFEVLGDGRWVWDGEGDPDPEVVKSYQGVFCRVEWPEVNLNSDKQLIEQLEKYGWVPVEFTPKGNPRLTSESLEILISKSGLDPILHQFVKRRVVAHRYSMVKGWLGAIDEDGRIRGYVNPQGAVTLRMTHQRVVNVPKYKKSERYSEYYRACFTTTLLDPGNPEFSEEWSFIEHKPYCDNGEESREVVVSGCMALVGCDAKGIENRMLANRLNNPELTEKILGDLHTLIWKACEPYLTSRDTTKNFEYAFFYGAADLKLGTMLDHLDEVTEEEAERWGYRQVTRGPSQGLWKKERSKAVEWRLVPYEINGAKVRSLISEKIPDLGNLIENVVNVSKQGYIVGFDGRRLIMRRGFDGQVMTHKALNTLLQGDGALIMKTAQVFLAKWLEAEEIPAWFVNTVHDEYQIECWPSYRFRVAELAEEAIREAGRYYKLNVPLDAESKIGVHWGHTH